MNKAEKEAEYRRRMQEKTAQQNRERFPEVAKWIDAIRVHFPEAKVVSIRPLSQANHEQDAKVEPASQQ